MRARFVTAPLSLTHTPCPAPHHHLAPPCRRQRNALLANPVEQVLRGAAGRGASLSSPSLAPNPYDFQRAHAHPAAVRLAACAVKSQALRLQQRLYAPPQALGGDARAPPPPASLAEAAPAVLYATRSGTSYEDCAQAAVPFELEVVRLPLLPSLDAIASSSISSAAYSALCAAVRGLAGDGAGEGEGEGEGGAGEGEGEAGGLGFQCAAAALTSGALTLPAPSVNAALLPRATLVSAGRLHADYIAARELVLSPYFADPCGILEGSAEDSGRDCASVLGLPTLFCYECVCAAARACLVRAAPAPSSRPPPIPPLPLTTHHARPHPPPPARAPLPRAGTCPTCCRCRSWWRTAGRWQRGGRCSATWRARRCWRCATLRRNARCRCRALRRARARPPPPPPPTPSRWSTSTSASAARG